jgi:hypothetical protein
MKIRLFLPLVVLMASCSLFGKKEVKKKEEENKTQLVGRVASIPSGGGFALIEAYGAWHLPTGGILTSVGEGRGATLTVSGEKLGRFAAADIKAGTLQPGDMVYYRIIKDSADNSATTEPKPDSPENSKKEPSELPKS